MTYRSIITERTPLRERIRSWLVQASCLVTGHRWVTFKVHNAFMAHLSRTAGVDARCSSCGKISMWGGTRYDDEA